LIVLDCCSDPGKGGRHARDRTLPQRRQAKKPRVVAEISKDGSLAHGLLGGSANTTDAHQPLIAIFISVIHFLGSKP